MLALAEPPPPQTEPQPGCLISGLKHSPEWHREQEDLERAWLDAYTRWTLRHATRPLRGQGGPR